MSEGTQFVMSAIVFIVADKRFASLVHHTKEGAKYGDVGCQSEAEAEADHPLVDRVVKERGASLMGTRCTPFL